MSPQRNVQSQKLDEQILSAIAQPGLFLKDCELWEQASSTILFPNFISIDTPSLQQCQWFVFEKSCLFSEVLALLCFTAVKVPLVKV